MKNGDLPFTTSFLQARPLFRETIFSNSDFQHVLDFEFPTIDIGGLSGEMASAVKNVLEKCAVARVSGMIVEWSEYLCLQLKHISPDETGKVAKRLIEQSINCEDLLFWLRLQANMRGDVKVDGALCKAKNLPSNDIECGHNYYTNFQSFLRVIWIDKILNKFE